MIGIVLGIVLFSLGGAALVILFITSFIWGHQYRWIVHIENLEKRQETKFTVSQNWFLLLVGVPMLVGGFILLLSQN